MLTKSSIYIFLGFVSLLCVSINASDLQRIRAHSPLFPGQVSSKFEQLYKSFFVVLDGALPEVEVEITANEVRRAIRDVGRGRADIFFPFPCFGEPPHDANVRWGTQRIGYVVYGLFSLKSNPLTVQDLGTALNDLPKVKSEHDDDAFTNGEREILSRLKLKNLRGPIVIDRAEKALQRALNEKERRYILRDVFPYKIDTTAANALLIPFPNNSNTSSKNAFKKLLRKRIDGVIYPVLPTENLISSLQADDQIFRDVFVESELCFIVADTDRGTLIDKMISEAFRRVEESGAYDRLFIEADAAERRWVEQHTKTTNDLKEP